MRARAADAAWRGDSVRQSIQRESRKNFVLERSLADMDEKIKLLVKNRISVQEVRCAGERSAAAARGVLTGGSASCRCNAR